MKPDRPARTEPARRSLLQRVCLGLLGLFGWRAVMAPLPGPKGVIMVYPHTSNWDFIRGVLVRMGGVPCGLGFIDYATKTLGIQAFVRFSGNVEDDLAVLRAFYAETRGRLGLEQAPENAQQRRRRAVVHSSDNSSHSVTPSGTMRSSAI